jgi:low temperature requirement protein LtrA
MNRAASLLRQRDRQDSGKVTTIELFFDLVFVFAVTRLSHSLLTHLNLDGALQTALLLLAVWWVWIYTSWVTNWLDPERIPVRLCLFVLMLAGLLLSTSIPEAFTESGLIFAASYAFMQVGRTLFFLWAVRGEPLPMKRNFQRILAWLSLSSIFWIIGGLAQGPARFTWWTVALLLEFVSPSVNFWVPGLGGSHVSDWNVDGDHLSERCGLFVIIALGDSLLVTGGTFASLAWNAATICAALSALLSSMAMWWIYFDTGAERAHRRIEQSANPGRQARLAYTYLHALIVGGIIVCSVADELVLAHPAHADNAGSAVIAAIVGGPMLYLLGITLFKWVTNDRPQPPRSHLGGLLLLLGLWPLAYAGWLSNLALGACATAILLLVAIWESVALRRPLS